MASCSACSAGAALHISGKGRTTSAPEGVCGDALEEGRYDIYEHTSPYPVHPELDVEASGTLTIVFAAYGLTLNLELTDTSVELIYLLGYGVPPL